MPENPLDFDYQSTTPCSQLVLEAMSQYWDEFWGNPSSRQNRAGLYASAAIGNAREKLASILRVNPERVVFTSGATEANNLALLGHSRAMLSKIGKPGHLITLATEHQAVLDPICQLQKEGFSVTKLSPNSDGIINLEELESSFKSNTFMVTIMFANNEIGVLQPMSEISSMCKKRGVVLHSDAAQALGYLPIHLDILEIDLLSISAHKIYGPKGIGALVLNQGVDIEPLLWGGGQENGIRPGTVPVPLVVGFVKAVEIAAMELDFNNKRLRNLRDNLWFGLKKEVPDLILNGSLNNRLPHNLNFTVKGVNGNRLQKLLKPLITCSSSSACSNGSPSHVLKALGRTLTESESSLRLSLGRSTTQEDIDQAIIRLVKVIEQLRN